MDKANSKDAPHVNTTTITTIATRSKETLE